MARNWRIFVNSIFFVLGFAVIFSVVGVVLQTTLSNVAYSVQNWLARIGGGIIILFGLYLLGLIRPGFLEKEHKLRVTKRFSPGYVTSFVFGAAFAVGWTPCVTAALGAILALAAAQPGSAFLLMLSYTLGIGIPFLLVGLFAAQAQGVINRIAPALRYVNYVFGALLIALGVLVFTNELSRVANLAFATAFLQAINPGSAVGGGIAGLSILNLGIAFVAGLVSFLSPCILPLVPGFLSYLGTTAVKDG